jgi:anthranilate synthase component 1
VSFQPDFETFQALARKGNLVPVFVTRLADLETPVSAFAKLTKGFKEPHSFLFESVEGGERLARYSYLGYGPDAVLKSKSDRDPLTELEAGLKGWTPSVVEGLPPFWGGAVGYLSYDCVRAYEKIGDKNKDTLGFPQSLHYLTDLVVAFDHAEHKMKVIATARLKSKSPAALKKAYAGACGRIREALRRLAGPLPQGWTKAQKIGKARAGAKAAAWVSNVAKPDFLVSVSKALEYIKAGDIFQIQIGRRIVKETKAHGFAIYRQLRALNPSPYMFYFQNGSQKLIGASPEVHLKVEAGKAVIRPIAGTRRRGRSAEDDLAMEKDLQGDPKERAEHIMLVDLARNDIGRIAEKGSVKVSELMVIERYSHVMHLVSDVSGHLKPDQSVFDALRASFPAGTVTGAPKIRAMQIIEELEGVRRGPYGGALGFVSYAGDLNDALVIRTLYMDGQKVAAQASAGIVADSQAELEWKETENKLGSVVKAVELAEGELKAS